jgi:hypothetical protein
MAIAGITGIGHEHLVARVHIKRRHREQTTRCTAGNGDPLRGNANAESVLVMHADRFAQRVQAKRRGVRGAAFAHRADAGFDHGLGCGEVGLADLHVQHAASGALERLRAREHVHHFEWLDLGGAARR